MVFETKIPTFIDKNYLSNFHVGCHRSKGVWSYCITIILSKISENLEVKLKKKFSTYHLKMWKVLNKEQIVVSIIIIILLQENLHEYSLCKIDNLVGLWGGLGR